MKKYVPTYEGTLRKHALTVPHCISKCSGIRVFGRRIKSLVFSTDVAIIKNINADAIIAVYPFTPQAGITQAIIGVSDVPVFVGVGGGLTNGAEERPTGAVHRQRQAIDPRANPRRQRFAAPVTIKGNGEHNGHIGQGNGGNQPAGQRHGHS